MPPKPYLREDVLRTIVPPDRITERIAGAGDRQFDDRPGPDHPGPDPSSNFGPDHHRTVATTYARTVNSGPSKHQEPHRRKRP